MKQRIPFMLVLAFAVLSYTPYATGQSTYVVSGNPQAPPLVWEEHKQLVGLAPDIITSILTELNLPFSIQGFGDWQNVQAKTRAGEVDLILSAYRNKERESYLDFSIPYLAQPVVIIVEKGKEFDFSSWEALKGRKGVSNVGESYGDEFDAFIKDHLDMKYYRFERAIRDLNLGEFDYLIIDLYTALIYARLLQGEESITILDPPVTVQNFHFAVRKDSQLAKYLPQINEKLGEKIADKTLSETLLHHFDRWKRLIDRRSDFLAAQKGEQTEQQKAYLEEQDEIARQRVIKTMVDREGLPEAAQ